MDYTNYNNYSIYSNYTNTTNHEKALFVGTKTIWYSQFSHDVAKIQTKKLLIPLCFYFHKVLRATFCKYHSDRCARWKNQNHLLQFQNISIGIFNIFFKITL